MSLEYYSIVFIGKKFNSKEEMVDYCNANLKINKSKYILTYKNWEDWFDMWGLDYDYNGCHIIGMRLDLSGLKIKDLQSSVDSLVESWHELFKQDAQSELIIDVGYY